MAPRLGVTGEDDGHLLGVLGRPGEVAERARVGGVAAGFVAGVVGAGGHPIRTFLARRASIQSIALITVRTAEANNISANESWTASRATRCPKSMK